MAESAGKYDNPIWDLTPFVDLLGQYGDASYFFECEREWHHVRDLKFSESDPAFLTLPEADHEPARSFCNDVRRENIGPNYACPFIDPFWDTAQISKNIAAQRR